MRLRSLAPLLLVIAAAGCRLSEEVTAPVPIDIETQALHSKRGREDRGTVYVQTNAVAGNAVLAFPRLRDGTLGEAVSYRTGGTGTGTGLGNQGGVILSSDGKWLFVVNAGSDEISSFQVSSGRLRLVDKTGSGGSRPISLTTHADRLFVLNIGGEGNVAGFQVRHSGDLERIRGASRPLSGPATMAAQISFSPDGKRLVVTERATNSISLYSYERDDRRERGDRNRKEDDDRDDRDRREKGDRDDRDGRSERLTGPISRPSSGMTPFGFAFDRSGTLIVAEAFGGAAGASAVSSYRLREGGGLKVLTASLPTRQTSACWLAVSPDHRFAYTANTGGGTITGFRIGEGGSLNRLQGDGVTATTGGGPADLAFGGERFLYVRNGGANRIDIFAWRHDGRLEEVGTTALPPGSNGIAAN